MHALRSQREKEDQAVSVVHIYISGVYFNVCASIPTVASIGLGVEDSQVY